MKKKVAIFGGSFDPFHTDHLNIIKSCKEKLNFDEVWIVPAFVNPFKNISSSSANQRLKMIELGIENLDYVKINKYEISKQEKSYTYSTIQYLQSKYPNLDFEFIMGSDQLDSFENWNFFDDLIKVIKFNVFLRDEEKYNTRIIKKYNLRTFTFDNNHLSSTDIRNLINVDKQIKKVNDYINENLLYIQERLESKMDEERFLHSLNVGQYALTLAKLNNVDLNKALVAGTLHDVAKRWDKEKMKIYLKKYNPSLLQEPEPVWHSYVGAYHLKHDWLFDDDEIINAVFKHTVADVEMSNLDMIVFCADKLSIDRDYEGIDNLRKRTISDLKLGFKIMLKNQYDTALKKYSKDLIGEKIKKSYKKWIGELDD